MSLVLAKKLLGDGFNLGSCPSVYCFGNKQVLEQAELAKLCPGGKITSIECTTVTGIASYSSGEVMECTMEGGAVCRNADNYPMNCNDYKIRYYCQCEGKWTSVSTCTQKYVI